jgi:hypothetical protein
VYTEQKPDPKLISILRAERVLHGTATWTFYTAHTLMSVANGKTYKSYSWNMQTQYFLHTDVYGNESPKQIIFTNNVKIGLS